ncbi:MAG: LysM peptidoglycan-binding domain-containing protein [Bacteroidia bacterium]
MKYFFSFLLCLLGFFSMAQDEPKPKLTVEQYIEKYSALAVEEMYRSHIPASITLAQGILESGNGNSRLATKANNHFGIKCKTTWTGQTLYEDDDAPQECFRKYDAAIDSYRDHSDFLMNNKRYAFLFDLDSKDYKAWAFGLKKAGYATNPQYPELLITFIEKHGLHKYDEIKISEEEQKEKAEEKAEIVKTYGKEMMINGVPAITAKANESYAQIALNYEIKVYNLYKYNDLQKDDECKTGDTIFIKNKRNKAEIETYVFAEGDNIHAISQRFGTKIEKILSRNNLVLNQQPAVGQIIYLNSKRPDAIVIADNTIQKDSVEIIKTEISPNVVKIDTIILNETVYEDPKKNMETMYPINENTLSYFDTLEEKKSELSFFHTVQAGETLYGIAKKYNVKVDALQFLNAMNNNNIEIGQKLIVNPNLPSADTKEPQPVPGFHIVRHGETLFAISKMYNISVSDLKAINILENNDIKIDQRLIIVPVKNNINAENKPQKESNEPFYYSIQKGETLFAISRKFNVSITVLKQLNSGNLNQIRVGEKIRIR